MPVFDRRSIDLANASDYSGKPSTNPQVLEIQKFRSLSTDEIIATYGRNSVEEQAILKRDYEAYAKEHPTNLLSVFIDPILKISAGLNSFVAGTAGTAEGLGKLFNDLGLGDALDFTDGTQTNPLAELDKQRDTPSKPFALSDFFDDAAQSNRDAVSDRLKSDEERARLEYVLDQENRPERSNTVGGKVQQFADEAIDFGSALAKHPEGALGIIYEALGSSILPGLVGAKTGSLALSAISEGFAESSPKETYRKIMEAPTEFLLANSPKYVQLLADGMTNQEARRALANQASRELIAGKFVTSSLLAYVGGNKAEKALVGGKASESVGEFGVRATKELFEEGTQEVAQTVITDVVESRTLDENIDIGKDAGKAFVEGAVGGVGITAGGQAVKTTKQAVQGSSDVISDIVKSASDTRKGNKKTVPTLEEVDKKLKSTEKGKTSKTPVVNQEVIFGKDKAVELGKKVARIRKKVKAPTNTKLRAFLSEPSQEKLDSFSDKARASLGSDINTIRQVDNGYKKFILDNYDSKDETVQEQISHLQNYINSPIIKRFVKLGNTFSGLEQKPFSELKTKVSPIRKAVKGFEEIYNREDITDSIRYVGEQKMTKGQSYTDPTTGDKIQLPGLNSIVDALELAIDTGDKSIREYTFLNGIRTLTAEVEGQLESFADNDDRKAQADIKSVELGGKPVQYAKSKNAPGRTVVVHRNPVSIAKAEVEIAEANTINKVLNAFKRAKNPNARINDTVYVLPEHPEIIEDTATEGVAEGEAVSAKEEQKETITKPEETATDLLGDSKEKVSNKTQRKVLISGGRKFNNADLINKTLDGLRENFNIVEIIEGGAEGADAIGKAYANNNGITSTTRPTNWQDFTPKQGRADRTVGAKGNEYNKYAGLNRNIDMLIENKPDIVLVFEGGTGTQHMLREAQKAGITVVSIKDENSYKELLNQPKKKEPASKKALNTDTTNSDDAIIRKREEQITADRLTGGKLKEFFDSFSSFIRLPGSRLSLIEQTLNFIKKPMTGEAITEALSGTKADSVAIKDYERERKAFITKGTERANYWLNNNTKVNKGTKYKPIDLLKNRKEEDRWEVATFNGLGAYALVQEKADGTFEYHPDLIDSALSATFNFIMNYVKRPVRDTEHVAKIMGISEFQVTEVHIAVLNFGTTRKQAINSLQREIMGFWNANYANTGADILGKIPGDLAAEIYSVLSKDGVILENNFKGYETDKGIYSAKIQRGDSLPDSAKDYFTFNTKEQSVKDFAKELGAENKREFSKALNNSYENDSWSFEPVRAGSATQQGSRVALTDSQKKVIELANNRPYTLNSDLADALLGGAIDTDTLKTLLGAPKEPDDNLSNETDAVNKRGKINTIDSWIENIQEVRDGIAKRVQDRKTIGDKNIQSSEVSVFFPAHITKVLRLGQSYLGPVNSKLMREMMLGDKPKIDLNNKEDMEAFNFAVHVAMGLKHEKYAPENFHELVEANSRDAIETKYKESLNNFKDWLKSEERVPFTPEQSNTLLREFDPSDGTEFVEIHALMMYAKYQLAIEQGNTTDFENTLYIEGDGRSDGIHNLIGNVTATYGSDGSKKLNIPELLRSMKELAKGGTFIKEALGVDINNAHDFGGNDFYEDVADNTNVSIQGNSPVSPKKSPAFFAWKTILEGSPHENNKWVSRSDVKGTSIKVPYGVGNKSAIKSIAFEEMASMLSAISEEIEIAGEGNNGGKYYTEDLQTIWNELFGLGIRVKDLFDIGTGSKDYAKKFSFTEEQKLRFMNYLGATDTKEDIKEGGRAFGSALYSSAKQLTSTADDSIEVFLKVYNVLAYAGSLKLKEVLADYKAKSKKYITRGELFKIVDKIVYDYGLDVQTPYGNINASDKVKERLTTVVASQDESIGVVRDEIGINPETGVAILPIMNIGFGDAFVVQQSMLETGGESQSYDGRQIAGDRNYKKHGQIINKASLNGLLKINMGAYLDDSYDRAYSKGLLKGITFVPTQYGNQPVNVDILSTQLKSIAEATKLKQAFLSEATINSVHYDLGPGSGYRQEGTASTKEGEAVKEGISFNAESFANVAKNGLKNSDNATSKELWKSILKVLRDSNKDFTIIYLDTVSKGYRSIFPKDSDANAAIDITKNTIYVKAEENQENYSRISDKVLHEIIHGLTIGSFYKYFADETLEENTKSSIDRLIKLANRFSTKTFDTLEGKQRELVENLQDIVAPLNDTEASATKRATALSEFVAHFLANKEYVAIGKRLQVPEQLKKLARRVFETIAKLWGVTSNYQNLVEAIQFEFGIVAINDAEIQKDENLSDRISKSLSDNNESAILYNNGYVKPKLNKLVSTLNRKFAILFDQYDNTDQANNEESEFSQEEHKLLDSLKDRAESGIEKMVGVGFSFKTREDEKLFKMIHTVIDSEVGNNSLVRNKMFKLFQHILNKVDVETLGKDKYDAIFSKDIESNENLLASFIALSQTNDEFSSIIDDIPIPGSLKAGETDYNGFIRYALNRLVNTAINALTFGSYNHRTHSTQAFKMVKSLKKIHRPSKINKVVLFPLNTIEKGWEKGIEKTLTAIDTFGKDAESRSQNVEDWVLSKSYIPVLNAWREVMGSNDDIEPILNMGEKFAGTFSANRQRFFENVGKRLKSKFKNPVSKREAYSLTKTLIHADMIAHDFDEMVDIVSTDKKLQNTMKILEDKLLLDSNGRTYIKMAEELSDFILTGSAVPNMPTNAKAISRLLGTGKRISIANAEKHEADIDLLITLYVLEGNVSFIKDFKYYTNEGKAKYTTAKKDLAILRNVIKRDKEALRTTFVNLKRHEQEEQKKLSDENRDFVNINRLKGSGKQERNRDPHIIIDKYSDEERRNYLESRGYKVIHHYLDGVRGERYAYYYSNIAKHLPYAQGAGPITNESITHNVSQESGFETSSNITVFDSGIGGKFAKERASKNSHYLPIFNTNGTVRNYKGYVNPLLLDKNGRKKFNNVVRKNDIFNVAAYHRGRLEEENAGHAFNIELMDRVLAHTRRDMKNNPKAFINIADPALKDPVYKESWKRVSPTIKKYIAEQVGNQDEFFIRRDLIDNTLGYPLASMLDPFTGVTRYSKKTAETIEAVATLVFGKKAYATFNAVNTGILKLGKFTKETIVIRSGFIPIANVISDVLYKLSTGISPIDIVKGYTKYIREIRVYTRRKLEETNLRIDIQDSSGEDRDRMLKRIRALQSSYKSLDSYALIEQGHLSTITEGLSKTDLLIPDGKIADYMEKTLNDLPENVRKTLTVSGKIATTIPKELLIARDSAIFKALAKSIQYGTFISKAVLYEDLRKKGMEETKALADIRERFVDYSFLPGRTRTFIDSFGLSWFINYMTRILKIAVKLIKEHPARAFLYSIAIPYAVNEATSGLIDILGGPLTDNILAKIISGRVLNSIGPEMFISGMQLHPLYILLAQIFGWN